MSIRRPLSAAAALSLRPCSRDRGARRGHAADGFYRYPQHREGASCSPPRCDLWKFRRPAEWAPSLTAYEGEEKCRPSLRWRWIAFTAQYEGNDDVSHGGHGGEPVRLDWHPMPDQVSAGRGRKIVFRAARHAPTTTTGLPNRAEGGIPSDGAAEPAAWISSSRAGADRLREDRLETLQLERYKGGEAEQIYIGTTDRCRSRKHQLGDGKDAFRCGPRTGGSIRDRFAGAAEPRLDETGRRRSESV